MKSLILGVCLCLGLAFAAHADPLKDLKRKADGGDVTAQVQMGLHFQGELLNDYPKIRREVDLDQAQHYYRLAAEQNSREAMIRLGTIAETDARHQNIPQAIFWYQKADFAPGLCRLYADETLIPRDPQKIVPACKAVIEDVQYARAHDRYIAEYQMGLAYFNALGGLAKDTEQALLLMKQASEHGYLLAHEWLVVAYFEGLGTAQDHAAALTYLEKLSLSNSALYLDYMGRMFEAGINFPEDQAEAQRFYFHAAENNNPHARQWMKDHPEVTADSLNQRKVSLLDLGTLYPYSIKGNDGVVSTVSPFDMNYRRMGDYYPARAIDNEIEGRVVIECQFNDQARLEHCIILEESPQGYGFGAATRKMMTRPLLVDDREGFIAASKGKWSRTAFRWILD